MTCDCGCGLDLPAEPKKTGRPQRYALPRCRKRAERARAGRSVWVELCAGSAACALAHTERGLAPPAPWSGNKRRFAPGLLAALGRSAGAPPSRIVLAEPGPWGWAWAVLLTEGAAVAAALRALQGEPAAALWARLAAADAPADPVERAAAWLVLQYGAALSKPVTLRGDGWKTPGYAKLSPSAISRGFTERLKVMRIADRVDRLTALQGVPVDLHHGVAESVEVPRDGRGYAVLIDPPYVGTTGYGAHKLPRGAVLDIARRWHRSGARVGVCEAVPLGEQLGRGWHSVLLLPSTEQPARQRLEWVTVNRSPGR